MGTEGVQVVEGPPAHACDDELPEAHGAQADEVHLPHGEGVAGTVLHIFTVGQGQTEQGPGAGYVVLRRVLEEVLQRRQRGVAHLDLVEYDQGVPVDVDTRPPGEVLDYAAHVQVPEQAAELGHALEVEVCHLGVVALPELPEDVGLTALADAQHHQGLPVRRFLPFQQPPLD